MILQLTVEILPVPKVLDLDIVLLHFVITIALVIEGYSVLAM